jgi:hypothetical protein
MNTEPDTELRCKVLGASEERKWQQPATSMTCASS